MLVFFLLCLFLCSFCWHDFCCAKRNNFYAKKGLKMFGNVVSLGYPKICFNRTLNAIAARASLGINKYLPRKQTKKQISPLNRNQPSSRFLSVLCEITRFQDFKSANSVRQQLNQGVFNLFPIQVNFFLDFLGTLAKDFLQWLPLINKYKNLLQLERWFHMFSLLQNREMAKITKGECPRQEL